MITHLLVTVLPAIALVLLLPLIYKKNSSPTLALPPVLRKLLLPQLGPILLRTIKFQIENEKLVLNSEQTT